MVQHATYIARHEHIEFILEEGTFDTGIILIFHVPEKQATARFLNPRERSIVIERIRGNFQGIMGISTSPNYDTCIVLLLVVCF